MLRNSTALFVAACAIAASGFAAGYATAHWGENTGKVPAVWIAVDIPKP